MKKLILFLGIGCFAVLPASALADRVEVGKLVEEATWNNGALEKTLLWEMLQQPASPKALVVEVQAERKGTSGKEDVVFYAPAAKEIRQEAVLYLQTAWREWRTSANAFLPKKYRLPEMYVTGNPADGGEDLSAYVPIHYNVILRAEERVTNSKYERVTVVGRAGYYKDGSRSSMFLPILRNMERYFALTNAAKHARQDDARSRLNWKAQMALENYKKEAVDMLVELAEVPPEDVSEKISQTDIDDMYRANSFSPVVRIIRAVITHEFGHHLGLSHGASGTLMAPSPNERSSVSHVTDEDGRRLAVLVCFVHNHMPDAKETCKPYKRARK